MAKFCRYVGREQFRALFLRKLCTNRIREFRHWAKHFADIADTVADKVDEHAASGGEIESIKVGFYTGVLVFWVTLEGEVSPIRIQVGPFPK